MKSCRWCGRVHPVGYACPKRPIRLPRSHQGGKRNDDGQQAIRSSKAWTKMSLAVRERDKFLCQLCLRGLHTIDGRKHLSYDDVSVHHIVPLIEDKSLAFEGVNLLSLCGYHHQMAEEGLISRDELSDIARQQEEGTRPTTRR